jgi:hypothetical protein
VPDNYEPDSEVERLAGSINDSVAWVSGLIGCLLKACLYLILGFAALEVVFLVVGGTFNVLEQMIGFVPAVLVFAGAAWLIVRLCRRPSGGR